MRQLLIRLLLLSVFLNMVVAMPAHKAEHLQALALASLSLAQPAQGGDSQEHDHEAQGLCAWCLAHAHADSPPASSSAAVLNPAWRNSLHRPKGPASVIPNPGRWPFASRDPPGA